MENIPRGIQKDVALAPHTTLGVGGFAQYYVRVTSIDVLQEVCTWAKAQHLPITILGGGSNVLIADTGVTGLVIHIAIEGITYSEIGERIEVQVGAGVVLDTFVANCVEKGYWGVENFSGIPGTVGAIPVQNVGAYGVEAKNVIKEVIVYDSESQSVQTFSNDRCMFAYRDSIFKKEKQYIIVTVVLLLQKTPIQNIAYADLQKYFGENKNPSIDEIRNAILTIRSGKFPNWHTTGTAGSFFKNPIVNKEVLRQLQNNFPEIPQYPESENRIKISLGWILDHVCGLKGYRRGNVWLYEKQALVLACEKPVTTEEIDRFATDVEQIVFEKTGIHIEREVTMIRS